MSPEERIKHFEKMAEFWKKIDSKTAGQYANKARKLREKLDAIKE